MVRRLLLIASALGFSGCLLPSQGTPVFVDLRAGDFWSGRGVLTAVSEDQSRWRLDSPASRPLKASAPAAPDQSR